jgi:phosphohistidine phosphatase
MVAASDGRSEVKTLLLVRHAKSSRDDPSLPDRDRPLDERGERDAPKIGKRLAKRDLKPDLLISSPATRALATAHLIADELGCRRKDIVVNDRLYASDADTLLQVIHELDDKLRCVMLFGHNPEFSDLAHRWSNEITDMPTCAVAAFTFDTKSWSQVGRIEPAKVSLDHPKN